MVEWNDLFAGNNLLYLFSLEATGSKPLESLILSHGSNWNSASILRVSHIS